MVDGKLYHQLCLKVSYNVGRNHEELVITETHTPLVTQTATLKAIIDKRLIYSQSCNYISLVNCRPNYTCSYIGQSICKSVLKMILLGITKVKDIW